jgi:hypothetical protein
MSNESFGDKAGSVVNEGLKVLRDSLREAGRLINVTADATRMHIEKESRVVTTHREFHRLGEHVYTALKGQPGATSITLTEPMRAMIARIQAAEADIAKNKRVLDHMSVVNVSGPTKRTHAKRVTKKKPAAKKAVKKTAKKTTKKTTRTKRAR